MDSATTLTVQVVTEDDEDQVDSAVLDEIKELQKKDAECKMRVECLEDGVLPEDDKQARKFSPHFSVIGSWLVHESPHKPGRWCVVVPEELISYMSCMVGALQVISLRKGCMIFFDVTTGGQGCVQMCVVIAGSV